jgi:Co/Zn/Cd efflux system component
MRQEQEISATLPIDTFGQRYTRSLWLIMLVALLLCIGEMTYGYLVSSREVLKSGAEWFYDVSFYGLAAISFGRSRLIEQRAAFALAAILATGGVQSVYEVWHGIVYPVNEKMDELTISAIIDVMGDFAEATLLFQFRGSHDPVVEATWLSARNSILTSALGGAVTLISKNFSAHWPQIVVDALGAFLAFQVAFVVVKEARDERW